jgi:23S rRNA pseudouridine2605 synthase
VIERIQKIIAASGRCSRREAEALITAGLVTVNGEIAELGQKADPSRDAIKVEGKLLRKPEPHRYILLNKPRGVVTTAEDPEGRTTVVDLVRGRVKERVYPVGRLDVMTEGLLILTNDGEFALRVTHPSYGCSKEYEAKVTGVLPDGTLARLRRGILLEGKRTAPADIELIRQSRPARHGKRGEKAPPPEEPNAWYRVILREGRNQQVRKLFDAVGHPVLKLRRVAIGPLRSPRMPIGTFRELEPQEIRAILAGGEAAASREESRRTAAPPRDRAPARRTGGFRK